jgi:hypothetical protein
MKINTELQDSRVIETNITTVLKSHKFSIDNEAAILKNARQSMYKYPIRTLVQEYLSNGRDSCREAKTGFKIDVTLPTSTKLIFKVRDYGVGLSPERVLNVFMKFGKSTKTETDEFTGGFGFGAKSGFAYTDNFTIISTFNGKCYHYSASVDNSPEANDVGSLDLLSVNESSEPNGVEIQIAVAQNDLSAFLQAYYRATFFWKERPNVIGSNGTGDSSLASWYLNPNSILSFENIQLFKSEDLGSLFQNKKKDYNNGLIFVIDGIPYTIEVGDPLNSLESVKSLVSQI